MALNHDSYTVGWICALNDVERPVAEAMLDNEHMSPLSQDNSDPNIYTRGDIAGHNVVIACLPAGRYGTNAAAVAAQNMLRTFPRIRFGLMVGIGGGAPDNETDIRLGDIVVSQQGKGHGGVVQYDLGKSLVGDEFKITGHLDSPPTVLLNAIGKLQSSHRRRQAELNKHLAKMLEENEMLQEDFKHPGVEHDLYYGNSDAAAAMSAPQERAPRRNDKPKIHYGLIASGNQVIKSADKMEELRQLLSPYGKVLCVEMEAAGLMNDFKCVVIRGISDYADSYKNDGWHGYAAAVAAAYAKELLCVIPPDQARATSPAAPSAPSAASGQSAAGQSAPKESESQHRQVNNFFGGVKTYGGKSSVGGTYNSGGGPMNF